jgi:hypothetical protein
VDRLTWRRIAWAAGIALAVVMWLAVLSEIAYAQSTQSFIDWAINGLSRQIEAIEANNTRIDARLSVLQARVSGHGEAIAVLQSDMSEIKWAGRGVLVLLIRRRARFTRFWP